VEIRKRKLEENRRFAKSIRKPGKINE